MARAAGRVEGSVRASVWLEDGVRARRGGQPSGLDRERITGAAVRLLDAEGLAKFSMRRLAAELNVTAMSVYWYVDNKDDLLELALDQAFGELRLPPEDSDEDWRDQLRTLAKEYRAVLVRHPWVSPLAGTFLNIGPHSLDFSLAVQRVIRRTGLPAYGQTGAISAVFQFVYGFGTIEGHFIQRAAGAGMTQEEYFRHAMSAVADAPQLGEIVQQSADLMEARGGDTVEEMRERDFTYALETLIAGIEVMVERG
ncbi:TetR/AcrR family transcriptional regulator [Streptomyces ipomoeae]|uniref:TetR/AcrR family transcriptional regulator n=1 Tax=Streptomyces ipomoeae TaxID=103232 RepID=A0A540Q3T1_9ACTN|nr:TetR/AcrR family transcriptional regulator [Streptomyces ipomoeae]MDX2699862.1 TetR/AcrR family transcriptional regulator [Streptomyces ipomoeae]MDX2827316.1 TetR/AcrR family transcriptional regulator [Streptomyces ipomoeae]MDX2845539.1 TetR/AcrR family transcriptional regulator [Streptomyces ipomoeae]MDX2877933.1 TetR/AcrR family transcriptional regulator [Streptomyces ipomoeae]MDX2938987.1 TetR/AcrR family transcriptional regulator [Streptomyces ipomoeae]